MNKKLQFGLLVAAVFGYCQPTFALDLKSAFQNARVVDAKYKGAEADLTLNQYQAKLANSAFMPSATYGYKDALTSNTTGSSGNTLSITQPIFSLEKFDLMKEARPKEVYADALLKTYEQDLASRLLKAVSDLILANEGLKSSETRINNLKMQMARATRMLELGQGTITDKRDIETRYQQAVSSQVTYQINQRTAEMQIYTLCRMRPEVADFKLLESHKPPHLEPFEKLIDNVMKNNPSLIAARSTEEISRLEASRARNQIMPTVSIAYSRAWGGNTTDNDSTNVTLSIPLDATKVISRLSANASEEKAFELRRQSEDQVLLQTNQYYESVMLGYRALLDKRLAIEAAQLSVEANEKSSKAGVRTMIEVLNSIDLLFQAKNEYATTAVSVGNSLLNLLLLDAKPPSEAVAEVQNFLFGN